MIKSDFLKGLVFVVLLASCCQFIATIPIIAKTGISSLILAILAGMIITNSYSLPSQWIHGIQFASKRLLRIAIIFYGFRISIQELLLAGPHAFMIALCIVILILIAGYLIGKKIIKLDTELSLLISIGAAVCGAAAVLALEDILKSQAHKTSIAIATVVIFGTLSMFLYPLFYQYQWLHFMSNNQAGIFLGASIHEVAQVVAASTNIEGATKIAVIVKMMRVILLMPLLLVLTWINKRYRMTETEHKKVTVVVPWFAFGFLLVIGVHSLFFNDAPIVAYINQVDTFLLAIAMGAIGLETKWEKIKHVGIKPFYLAGILSCLLFVSAFLLVSNLC